MRARVLESLALAIALAGAVAACSAGSPAHPGSSAEGASSRPSACKAATEGVDAQTVNACLGESAPGTCLDALFREYLKSHTTVEALALLQCLEDTDTNINVSCHPVAHAIGRETFAIAGTVDKSFAACDQTCHSGCYHGAMERFLRGDAEGGHISFGELQAKAASACSPSLPLRYRFQCLHGLGHAVMYYSEYVLKTSLAICDATGDAWTSSSCWGGVFMENVAAASPDKRDLSPTDVHYPCDVLDDRYKSDCYVMQTSRMAEMGLKPPQILEECRKTNAYVIPCSSSLGRDLSDQVRFGDPRGVSATCELADGDQRAACTRGVVFALADNTWDARWVFPYCRTYAGPADALYCFHTAVSYLESVYVRSADELRAACSKYLPGDTLCLSALQ